MMRYAGLKRCTLYPCPAKRLTPMGLFATDDVCGQNYVACGASLRGLFAALVVEIGIFVAMFGV